jgi:ATP-dependent RNA helicase RhlE
MLFSELGLKAELQRAVADQGYDTPTPIQQQAIPAVLAGHDLMATAQTGTGKTAGFTLPILHLLAGGPNDRLTRVAKTPRVLVLTPTRELAIQVEESVRTYGKHLPINSLAVFGGVGINPQIANLRRGVDILVATPGRLLDHVQQRTVDLSKIEIFVLDEADRMLDMGFIRDIRKIIALLPKQRQNLMFSATFSPDIRELAAGLLHQPVSVDVAPRNTAAETVTQRVIETDREKKKELLCHLFESRGWHQVLVFARTKHGADALARTLDKAGIKSAAIHGDKSQGARTRALSDFKDGKLVALVATDIAARGIDIDALPYVINYELPNVPEDYVHRIGRTGRAGMEGEAISLVCHDERANLRDIEKLIKRNLERIVIPGFEQSATAGKNSGRPQQHHNGNRHR